MDDDSIDTFDDLFEPFGLERGPNEDAGAPKARRAREPVPVRSDTLPGEPAAPRGSVTCASCGNPNDPANRHCDKCGARLARSQMPVAPQPMLRTTAGARALIVLAAVVLFVAMLALVFNAFGGSDTPIAGSTTTPGTTAATVPISQLTPLRVTCSSELASFPCDALVDGDPDTSWNATEAGGLQATITILFSPPVQITELIIENLDDEGRFLRNQRIKSVTIDIDDLVQSIPEELADTNDEPHRIQIRSLSTSSVIITITSVYPGQAFEGREPFPELAVQEISFYGRPAPGSGG